MTRTVPWEKIAHPNRCHYCGTPLDHRNRTRDHIVPRALGGTQSLVNLVLCCQACNTAKADSVAWCACLGCMAAVAYHATLMRARVAP